jgi:hypothetical protein
MPVLPPTPTASSAIDKLLGVLPKTLPKVKEKKDPKDSDTILSSKTDDGTTTVSTKVDKKSDKMTNDYNRGFVMGLMFILNQVSKLPVENQIKYFKEFSSIEGLENFIKTTNIYYKPKEFKRRVAEGMKMGIAITDGIDIFRGPPEKK